MSKTALFKAAKAWQANDVIRLLGLSPDLACARDPGGRTSLHLCCATPLRSDRDAGASIATAQALLDAGAALNAIQPIADDGEIFPAPPLWYALGRGRNLPLVAVLIAQGANPDPGLWTVVWSDDAAALALLLSARPCLEDRFQGETPLLYAARLGREARLPDLVQAGADIRARDTSSLKRAGSRALDHARRHKMSSHAIASLSVAQED